MLHTYTHSKSETGGVRWGAVGVGRVAGSVMEILNETPNEQSCVADGPMYVSGTRCCVCVAANVFHCFLIAFGDESIQLISYVIGCHQFARVLIQ